MILREKGSIFRKKAVVLGKNKKKLAFFLRILTNAFRMEKNKYFQKTLRLNVTQNGNHMIDCLTYYMYTQTSKIESTKIDV